MQELSLIETLLMIGGTVGAILYFGAIIFWIVITIVSRFD